MINRLRVLAVGVVLVVSATAARAQAPADESSAFLFGPLRWTPAIALRDVGTDSNIFDTAASHVSDFTATLSPKVDALLDTARLRVSGNAAVDVVYFDHYASERSVNRQVATKVEAPLRTFVPFVGASYINARERQNAELDIRARRRDVGGTVGTQVLLGARSRLQFAARAADAVYSQGQTLRGYEMAAQLNRRMEAATAGFIFNVTPLTSFVSEVQATRDLYEVATIKNQRSTRATVGLEFAPDAVIRGRANIGYHTLDVSDPTTVPFTGLTADVDLSYVLLGVTRFDARYARDTTFSVEAPYYLDTQLGFSVLQTFLGPIDLTARANLQTLDYPGIAAANVGGRVDRMRTVGGGVVIRMSRSTRWSLTYDLTRRRSPLEALNFERQRLFTSILVGL